MSSPISREVVIQAINKYCNGCIYRLKDCWQCPVKGITAEINAAWTVPEEPADRWIPVTERLPEDDVSVLVSYIGLTCDKEPYKGVTVASYDSDFDGWYRDNDLAAIAVVTAWQPLPEPYKGGKQ